MKCFYRPGYIAGVTNPAFEDHSQWWDVLFNINTGKVTISSNIDKAHPVENRSIDKDSSSYSFDKDFMNDVSGYKKYLYRIFFIFIFIIYKEYNF